MNLDGLTNGDILGQLSYKVDDLPSAVLNQIDEIRKISGIRTRAEAVKSSLDYRQEIIEMTREGNVIIAVSPQTLEQLKMRGIGYYGLNPYSANYEGREALCNSQ